LAWFFSKKPRIGDAHYALYGAIVAQSRQPIFYAEWGLPDTLTGRFDMISLHMALVLRRLQQDGARSRDFAQGLFDLFFKDMDRSLREMGVGDISVPKRIEKMGSLFYGLVDGLGHALENKGAGALDAFVMRDLLPDGEEAKAPFFSAYVRRMTDHLTTISTDALLAGRLSWDAAV
jgi:cytochrome b pre-mRNA-processing protein 3